jgi:hypothetical protein
VNALSHNLRLTVLGYAFDTKKAVRERDATDRYLLRNQDAIKRNTLATVPSEYPFPELKDRKSQSVTTPSSNQVITGDAEDEIPDADTSNLTLKERIEMLATERGTMVLQVDLDPTKKVPLFKLGTDGKAMILESDFQVLLHKLHLNDSTVLSISFRETMRSSLCCKDEPRSENFTKLSIALLFNTSITDIDLYFVNMRDINLIELCAAFSTCINLRTLNLGMNKLSTTGVIELASMIESHPSLRVIKLEEQNGVGVGPVAEKHLINALSQNNHITNLAYTFRDALNRDYADKFLLRNASLSKQPQYTFTAPVYPHPECGTRKVPNGN